MTQVNRYGSFYVVDPNPPNNEMINTEDMFIYVKFSAYPRSRSTYGVKNSSDLFDVNDEVNFISTEIRYGADGKLNPSLQKTYATTEWSSIGSFNNTKSRGVLEGFGIKSISIKYNASLVPVVDITFTDVRGGALFDVIKDDDRVSPYSIFFKMPYPVFKLSVKGYFGQTVDYCLHMTNWTSSFDGSTGNFEISANFLGFQQAFLNDMNIGNIIAAVNTDIGSNKLRGLDWTIDDDNKVNPEYQKLDDFLLKISKLQNESEFIKADLDSFGKLKDLNGQIKLLKTIKSWIGGPLLKQDSNNNETTTIPNNSDYLKTPNKNDQYITQPISPNSNLRIGNEYLSIRDYIVLNNINIGVFHIFMKSLNNIVNSYKEYITSIGNNQELNKESEDLINSFYISDDNDDENYKNYVINKTSSGDINPTDLKDVLYKMGNEKDSPYYLLKDYDENSNNNFQFNITYFNERNQTFYNNILKPDSKVIIFDFRKQRALTENIIISLEKLINQQKEIVQKELNLRINENFKKQSGFDPKINSCFKIIANNTQALVESIHDITQKVEQTNKDYRKSVLNSVETDVDPNLLNVSSVAWPSLFQRKDNGSTEEIYIGEVLDNGNRSFFPEYEFIEKVFENLVSKRKVLSEVYKDSTVGKGLDTDNWFPINPLDYKTNPFLKLNTINDIKGLEEEISKQLLIRLAVLKNYSVWNNTIGSDSPTDYSTLDALIFNSSIRDQKIRDILYNVLTGLNSNSIKNTDYFKENLKDENGVFKFTETQPILFNDTLISGYRDNNKDVEYIILDKNDIINNSKTLNSLVRGSEKYTTIINKKVEEKTYTSFYNSSNNLISNISLLVWDDSVGENLLKINKNLKNNYIINSLYDIDITGTTESNGIGKYINMTNFYTETTTPKCKFENYLTESDLYKKQVNKYSKGLLLLSTLPFKPFKDTIGKLYNGKYEGSRIINIPKYYLYFLGAYLWKTETTVINPIKFDIDFSGMTECSYSIFSNDKNNYLTKIGYLATNIDYRGKDIPVEDELINLPKQTKKLLIKLFTEWVDSNFSNVGGNINGRVELLFSDYKNSDEISVNKEKSASDIKILLSSVSNMIVVAPEIFTSDKLKDGLVIKPSDFDSYINSFKNILTQPGSTKSSNEKSQEDIEKENKSTNKIKLQIYNYFKNINDKWVADSDENGRAFNICGSQDKDLYDYFKFIDRGWRDIGNKANFNLKSFLSLGSNLDTSVYFFISKLLRDSNFLLQILPSYVNFKDEKEVSKIFKPMTTIENNKSSGPIFACIYAGGNSQVLNIGERNNYHYKNDGFNLSTGKIPSEFTDDQNRASVGKTKDDTHSLVGFRVAFGAQNQTIFKNVSLNQQEHRETGEYFRVLGDLVDKRGGTQKTYQGTDLLKIFKSRSYTCSVDAMGCMNIQPMMYFDLQNVPFFNGAYLITNVSHNITPNTMSTTFQGVRQSQYIAPPVDDLTIDLDFNFNESSVTPSINYINLPSTSTLYTIGVMNPNEIFDYNLFNLENFNKLGVPTGLLTDEIINGFISTLNAEGMITNAQVTMFLSNVLSQSKNLTNKEFSWDVPELVNYELKFPIGDTQEGKTIYYGETTSGETEFASAPLYSSGTPNDIAYEIPQQNNDLYNPKYENIYSGDVYRFKPRGYLYVIGRKNYFEFYNKNSTYIINPSDITQTPNSAFDAAVKVWKNQNDLKSPSKTAFDYAKAENGGTSTYFSLTKEACQQFGGSSIEETFITFEKVLRTFDLLDENAP